MVQYGHYRYCIYILFGITPKETLELGIMGSLWDKSTGHQWNLSQKANNPEWASMSSSIMTEQKVFISNDYSDVIMATMASHDCLLNRCGEFTGGRWIPRTKGQ